jgi:sucrose-6-phosphate hydrolase SacC (GH32 family)
LEQFKANLIYGEKYRPRFHFSARENWLNDPNGCVFLDDEYHLFFQHNPRANEWGNMTWGHAVSPDLVHWKQLDDAIIPYGGGDIFSGSAVYDRNNSSGLGKGSKGALVAFFTHSKEPTGQCLAFSIDKGRTWDLYEGGRHIISNQGLDPIERDPKIFWYEPSSHWVMVLWVKMGQVRFFTSRNLLNWTYASDFQGEGFFECPDLIELPVNGSVGNLNIDINQGSRKWLLYDGALSYWVGEFDGRQFRAQAGPLQGEAGENFFAGQTFNNMKGRAVQIGWMRGGKYPAMPFNQQMSFPCELSLREVSSGIRLFRYPVSEIKSLYIDTHRFQALTVKEIISELENIEGKLFDIAFELRLSPGDILDFSIFDHSISFTSESITCFDKVSLLRAESGAHSARILVDSTSIEVFCDGGEVTISSCFLPDINYQPLKIDVKNGAPEISELIVHNLSSAWDEDFRK